MPSRYFTVGSDLKDTLTDTKIFYLEKSATSPFVTITEDPTQTRNTTSLCKPVGAGAEYRLDVFSEG